MNLVSFRKIKFFLRDYWATIITAVSLVVLLVLLSTSYRIYRETTEQKNLLQNEVSLLKNRKDTLNYNKTLTSDQIDTYNQILSALIPESEDYFSIIYALETISKTSGFSIDAYTINLAKTSPEKLSINVEGKGNATTFMKFLDDYEFSGGRLITSEKIEYSGGSATSTKVALNFYNKQYAFGETVIPQLTKKDISQLEKIKEKIKVAFADAESDSFEDYETKQNPF